MFKETRTLILEKHQIFLKQGSRAMEEMRTIRDRLTSLRTLVGEEFPLNDSQAEELRFEIAKRVSVVKEIETKAIDDLRLAISS